MVSNTMFRATMAPVTITLLMKYRGNGNRVKTSR